MLVTIQGVVNSDVCEAGAVHTVEWTTRLAGLVRSGLVVVTDWNPVRADATPEPEPEPVEKVVARSRGRRRASEE